ncbi:MAG: DUF4058 family protein, partial [Armatimonadota bacterium]|nr:DUF4058 family protein [Armatimonadota bacterium]
VEVAVDEPVILVVPSDYTEPFIVIIDPRGGRIITVIEVLSPTNKSPAGEGQMGYSRKLRELYLSGANIVEIDLLRGGLPTIMVETDPMVTVPPHDYLICISRAVGRHEYEIYPFALSDRLPRIAIPLRPPDADAVLDLPALFTRCYDNGAFAAVVDYRVEPNPPLTPDQATWAAALLREKGLRPPETQEATS